MTFFIPKRIPDPSEFVHIFVLVQKLSNRMQNTFFPMFDLLHGACKAFNSNPLYYDFI